MRTCGTGSPWLARLIADCSLRDLGNRPKGLVILEIKEHEDIDSHISMIFT